MSADQKGQLDRSFNEPKKEVEKRGLDRLGRPFADMSDNIGNQRPTANAKGHVIHWHSVPTGATVHFKAFLTDFTDRYESAWNDEEPFGRMDPISTFKSTKRVISLGWDVPAASVEEAKFNLGEAERFLSMLYPVYQDLDVGVNVGFTESEEDKVRSVTDRLFEQDYTNDYIEAKEREIRSKILAAGGGVKRRAAVMVAAPLFKLKFSNLIMDNNKGVSIKAGAAAAGLVGRLSGLSYEPDIEQGFFGSTIMDEVPEGTLIPQTIKFSCEFTVMHTSPLGWSNKGRSVDERKRSPAFPYHSDRVRGKK